MLSLIQKVDCEEANHHEMCVDILTDNIAAVGVKSSFVQEDYLTTSPFLRRRSTCRTSYQ